MGNALSCKRKKKKEVTKKSSHTNNNQRISKPKQLVLDKDRKIIQKDKELYQVVFDAEGFSVHDLALLGQKHSTDTLVKQDLKPKKMGRVSIIPDISQPPRQPPTPQKSPRKLTNENHENGSTGEFEIIEILDYIDDLYLQLLDPDRDIPEDRKDSTSNTENASSSK